MKRKLLSILIISIAFNVQAQENIDTEVINKIKKEGLENSKVMDIAFMLTDVSGPRLTNSPGYFSCQLGKR
jgi:hypothetical protein